MPNSQSALHGVADASFMVYGMFLHLIDMSGAFFRPCLTLVSTAPVLQPLNHIKPCEQYMDIEGWVLSADKTFFGFTDEFSARVISPIAI